MDLTCILHFDLFLYSTPPPNLNAHLVLNCGEKYL